MALNLKYVASRSGFLKLLHLVLGAIALGCGVPSHESEFVFERFFLGAVITCFVITFINLIVNMLAKQLQGNQLAKLTDFAYQIIGAILLLVGGSLMIASAKKVDKDYCSRIPPGWEFDCQRMSLKMIAGSFAIINGVFYFIAAASVAVDTDDNADYEDYSKKYGYNQSYGRTSAVKSQNEEEPE